MAWYTTIFCNNELLKIVELQETNKQLNESLKIIIEKNEQTNDKILLKEKIIEEQKIVIEELNKKVPEPIEAWEIEWEKKFKKIKVKWNCRPVLSIKSGKWVIGETIGIDVMSFWMPKTIQETAIMIRTLNIEAYNKKDWDTLAWKCEEYVKKKIQYVSELPKEYWKYPYETERDGNGDCEDGSMYLGNLMLAIGIPPGRIKQCVGEVEGGKHCYTSYCRTTDNKHVILDWCFWKTSALIKDRPLHSDNYTYYKVDFSFTPKDTWAQPDFKEVGS